VASVSITRRKTKSGELRHVVRYRLGGRAYPIEHGGAFKTKREAEERKRLISGELSAGRNPRLLLEAMAAPTTPLRTFAQVAADYRTSRVDASEGTLRNLDVHGKLLSETFGTFDPNAISVAEVTDWIAAAALKPSSVRIYFTTLRAILDFAGVKENPCRDQRVRLPRQAQEQVNPPSASEVEAIIEHVPSRWRLPLRVLEQTGMRVGELARLAWADVDVAGSRFRISQGKTASSRRWVAVPAWLMVEVQESCPPDDRTAERRVFPGFTRNVAGSTMRRACTAAGLAHYHPHDLRHRYASVKIAEGVPVTLLAAQLGHSKKSLTLDTYSHVLIDEGVEK
jgi:integrase